MFARASVTHNRKWAAPRSPASLASGVGLAAQVTSSGDLATIRMSTTHTRRKMVVLRKRVCVGYSEASTLSRLKHACHWWGAGRKPYSALRRWQTVRSTPVA